MSFEGHEDRRSRPSQEIMHWAWLIIAIVTEVAGTSSMKLSEGWTKLLPSIAVVLFFTISLFSITLALKGIPISTAYAIWAGLGIVLTSIIALRSSVKTLSR